MKITCPECSSSFDVPVPLMGAGRRVRCGNCGHVWVQGPVQEASSFGGFRAMDEGAGIDPIPASVHPGDDSEASHGDDGPGFFADVNYRQLGVMLGGFVLGWIVVAVLFLGLAMAHRLPNSLMPLAVALGASAPQNLQGLEFEDLSAKADQETTIVSGRVVNTSEMERTVPEIEITPEAADGTEVEPVKVQATPATLKAGESASFSVELPAVYKIQDSMVLHFID